MNRTYKYTFLLLLFAVLFIFFSMTGMKLILQFREKQLLTEKGSAVAETPVRAWYGQENDGESEGFAGEKHTLTDEQIADAIGYWNSSLGEVMHSPVEGQISMEEAIGAGEQWLVEMGLIEERGQGTDAAAFSVTATLSVGWQRGNGETQLEPYYSFWIVQFFGQDMHTILRLNAVTGKVWRAEITLRENFPEELPSENLRLFVELAGLSASDTASIIVNTEKTQAILALDVELDDGLLYGHLEYGEIVVYEYEKEKYAIEENGSDYCTVLYSPEYAVLTYEIVLNQN